jgi:hypothetical protein
MITYKYVNGTTTLYWSLRFFLWFQQCPVFSLHGLDLVLLFSNCSLLRAARLKWFHGKVLVGPGELPSSLFKGVTESCIPHCWFKWLPCMGPLMMVEAWVTFLWYGLGNTAIFCHPPGSPWSWPGSQLHYAVSSGSLLVSGSPEK